MLVCWVVACDGKRRVRCRRRGSEEAGIGQTGRCCLTLAPATEPQGNAPKARPDEVERVLKNTVSEGPAATELLCETIAREADANDLPVEFFASLIWKESRLDAQALSPRGAKGIAQFMQRTATWRGLVDPFEPQQALENLLGGCGNCGRSSAIGGSQRLPIMQARTGCGIGWMGLEHCRLKPRATS